MEQNDAEISEAILGYLAENPLAMDTLDAIAEWWLMRQQVRTSVQTLERVLREMTRSGVIATIEAPGAPRYRLKRHV